MRGAAPTFSHTPSCRDAENRGTTLISVKLLLWIFYNIKKLNTHKYKRTLDMIRSSKFTFHHEELKAVLQTPTGINIYSKCVLSEFEQVPLHEEPKVTSLCFSLNVATHKKYR